jgi:hypothetical protein
MARGEFPDEMPMVGGVREGRRPAIIEELERRDVLWKAQKFTHAYPHCWRCGRRCCTTRAVVVRAHDGVQGPDAARNARSTGIRPRSGAGASASG